MVASQRLVIQDEGMSIPSASLPPVADGIRKFSDNFANLIQEQKCTEKYYLSDCDGNRTKGGLELMSKVQKCSAEDEILWRTKQHNIHVEIKEKDAQQISFKNETEIVNTEMMKNVIGQAHEVVLGSEYNAELDLAQKFGMINHDEGWRPETYEDTRREATVSRCGQQQRIREIGHVTQTLDLQYMPQQLKQEEEIVAFLNCHECEQTRHMSSERGGIAPRASSGLQCKQVPSETVADVNSGQMLTLNQKCGVESSNYATSCQNKPNRLHRTDDSSQSESSIENKCCSCHEELSEFYPRWEIIKRGRRGCSSERTCCQVSAMSCASRTKHDIPDESVEHYCSCLSQSIETNVGHLPSAEESARSLHIKNQHQQVYGDCEQCKLELLSQAVVQGPGSDEGMKHILTQPQTPDHNVMSVCYRCLLEQEHLKVGNQIQNPKDITTLCQKCQSHCNLLCDIRPHCHNACLVNNSLQTRVVSGDRRFNGEQKNRSFHKSILFAHINQYDYGQQMLQEYGWDQRMCCTSPVCAPRLQIRHAKASICHQSRISRSGIPVNGPIQTNGQENAPVWQQRELKERNFQIGSQKINEICIKCHEGSMGCQGCEIQKGRKSGEEGEGFSCQQCELERRIFQMGSPEGTQMLVKGQEATLDCPECELQKQITQGTGFGQCESGKQASSNFPPEGNSVRFRCQASVPEEGEMAQVRGCRQGVTAPSAEGNVGVRTYCQQGTDCEKEQREITCEPFRHQYGEGLEEGVHHKKKRAAALWQRLLRKHETTRRKPISVTAVHPGP
jgi:hypothetical protein